MPPSLPEPVDALSHSNMGAHRAFLLGLWPTVLVAAVIAARFPETLWRAEFWAEDATEFFFDAVSLGPGSLLVPVYGYHFLAERVIAYLATFLPVFYAPYVYAWTCLVVSAAVLAYLARDGFSWIAPRRWQRIILATLLAVGPGTADVLLNLANLSSILALFGLLLLVERPFRLGPVRLSLLVVIVASSGQMILWLPVVGYLAWTTRRRAYLAAGAAILLFAALNGAGSHQASTMAGILDYRALAHVPRILLENAFLRLLPGPFLGAGPTGLLMQSSSGVFWGAAAVGLCGFAYLAWRNWRMDRDGTTVLVLAYLGAIGMFALIAVSRAYNMGILLRESGNLLRHIRYSFLPGATATLLWSAWLLRPRSVRRGWRIAAASAAGLLAFQLAACYPLRFARPDLGWDSRSVRVQELLDEGQRTGRPVVITIHDLAVQPYRWVPANGRLSVVVPSR